MTYEQARREYKEAKAAGNVAFIQCCFEVAIKQAEMATGEMTRNIDLVEATQEKE